MAEAVPSPRSLNHMAKEEEAEEEQDKSRSRFEEAGLRKVEEERHHVGQSWGSSKVSGWYATGAFKL
jgi:hypothetical protein